MNNTKQNSTLNLFLSVIVMLSVAVACCYLFLLIFFAIFLELGFIELFGPSSTKEQITTWFLIFITAIVSSVISNFVGIKILKFPTAASVKLFIFLQFFSAMVLLIVFDIDAILETTVVGIISYVFGSTISIFISHFVSKTFLPKN